MDLCYVWLVVTIYSNHMGTWKVRVKQALTKTLKSLVVRASEPVWSIFNCISSPRENESNGSDILRNVLEGEKCDLRDSCADWAVTVNLPLCLSVDTPATVAWDTSKQTITIWKFHRVQDFCRGWLFQYLKLWANQCVGKPSDILNTHDLLDQYTGYCKESFTQWLNPLEYFLLNLCCGKSMHKFISVL